MRDQTLILIPSPLVLPFSYHFLKKRLRKNFRLMIPELPGTALNFSRKLFWDTEDYAWWVIEYIHEKNLENVFLLGHSNSGAIAARVAELHPDLVRGIIIADTIGVEIASVMRTLWGRVVDAVIEWKLTLWGFHHLIFNLVFHPVNFIFQVFEATRKKRIKFKVPTLILWGQRDHTIPVARGEKLRNEFVASRMYISTEGSHDWIITHSLEATNVISNWTKEIYERQNNFLLQPDVSRTSDSLDARRSGRRLRDENLRLEKS